MAFNEWFLQQHGPRPADGGSDSDLKSIIRAGKAAEAQLASRLDWDHRLESALYAWQAREKSV